MGNKVDVIEEILARLENGITTGQPLADVKRIKIGSSEEARTLDDLPIINIAILSGTETPYGMPTQYTDEISLDISLIIGKQASDSNTIYDTSNATSGLYLFEKMLNVLDKNTSGVVNLGFTSTAYELRNYTWELDQTNDLLIFKLNITVKSKGFQAGAR